MGSQGPAPGSASGPALRGSGGFTTYDDARQDRQLRGWVEVQGILRVKIKIGQSRGTEEDRERDRLVRARRSIGGTAALFVDANGAYGVKQAVEVARYLHDLGVTWFEEPVSSDHLTALAQVRSRILPEVAAGEYGCGPRVCTACRSTPLAAAA